jgi:hypothetical protein
LKNRQKTKKSELITGYICSYVTSKITFKYHIGNNDKKSNITKMIKIQKNVYLITSFIWNYVSTKITKCEKIQW